jgi:hypothetical protein
MEHVRLLDYLTNVTGRQMSITITAIDIIATTYPFQIAISPSHSSLSPLLYIAFTLSPIKFDPFNPY